MPASFDPTEPQLTARPAESGSAGAGAPGSLVGEVLAGRYALTHLLGSGGMGAVYRGHDRELDEVVAVKVLHAEVAAVPGMLENFRGEVKLARRVTHRNVARTFEFGEHRGLRFLTMEFIRGEALTHLVRQGPLSLRRAAVIGAEICDALAAAHAAGIVHRDIKPDNVLLTADRVVVTDFGIARSSVDEPLRTGTPMGTPTYMAPEQVLGGPATAQTDLYALGATLFELLTGQPPWSGEGAYAVALRRLQEAPPDPRTLRPELPPSAAEVVLRCMAQAPEDRFASAQEVAALLRGLRDEARATTGVTPVPATRESVAATPVPKVLAVMPFRSQGVDDYLVEGLAEDLLDALSSLRGVRVLARGATLRFRGQERDAQEVGKQLRADVVVEGSLRKTPAKLRVTLRMIEVATGIQSWSGRWDVLPEEVLGVQDAAARAITEALAPGASVAAAPALEDAEAVALYLRGRQLGNQLSGPANESAIDLFELALARAPNNPRIMSSLSRALVRRTFYGSRLSEEVILRARALAEGAIARAPSFGEPYLAAGLLALHDNDGIAAMRAARAAVARAPNLADAHELLGRLLMETGRIPEARRRFETALTIDPNLARVMWEQIRIAALAGDWDEQQRLLAAATTPEHDARGAWLFQARYAAWRRDVPRLAEVDRAFTEVQDLVPQAGALVRRVIDAYRGQIGLDDALAWIDMVIGNYPLGLRISQWLLQHEAEIAGYHGRPETVVAVVRRLDGFGFFDVDWLDRCPLLAAARGLPGFAALRASVRARADAIVDAMWG
ncbi:MAG: protein kinase [Myxococcales bacterium]|nr:protein kinase [Myxococcales bacterium]